MSESIHQKYSDEREVIPSKKTSIKIALETLKSEHNFSPLLSVVKELLGGSEEQKYRRELRPGDILFDRGEDKHVYILTAGELSIQVPSRSGYKNVAKVQATNTLGEGTIFGRSFKPARAIALSNVSAIRFSDQDLLLFEQTHPELMHRFYRLTMEKMNHHLREANHQLSEYESLIDHLSQYLQNESSGLLEMLIYLRETFLLERVELIEYHTIIEGLEVVRYDSSLSEYELIYQANNEKNINQKDAGWSLEYPLHIGEKKLGILKITWDQENPLEPKDEQVIKRSIPTMSAILKAYQASEENHQKARLSSDKDLRDTTF